MESGIRFEKYVCFLNWVLETIGEELRVEHPLEFKKIPRPLILEHLKINEHPEYLETIRDILLTDKVYSKTEISYHKNMNDNYIMTVLKYLAKTNGFFMKCGAKTENIIDSETDNVKKIAYTIYTIVPKKEN